MVMFRLFTGTLFALTIFTRCLFSCGGANVMKNLFHQANDKNGVDYRTDIDF